MSDETNTQEEKKDTRKTIHINRLSLYGPTLEGSNRASRLYWSVFDGNPRITVRTNHPDDEKNNYGQISAPIDCFTMGAIAGLLRQAVKEQPGWREKITNKSTWHNGQKFDAPTRINDIIIGKDNEGSIYISVHEDNRPNIRFFFGPSQWHSLVKSDGTPVSKQELSCLYAQSYAEIVSVTIGTIIGYGSYVSTFTDYDGNTAPEDKPTFSRGPAPGGYQRGNNQGGGYNRGGGGGYNRGGGGYNRGGGGGYQKGNYQGGYNRGGGNNNYNRNNQQTIDNIANEDISI